MSHVRAAVLLFAALGLPFFAAACGGSNSGIAPPLQAQNSAASNGASVRISRMSTTASPPTSGYNMHVTGPIVAVQSSTEFQMNAGGTIGYINVYTSGASVYGTPAVGQSVDVYGNGSAATYITATWVNVGNAASSGPTPPTSGYNMHVSGPIVAVQSSTEFQINAGGTIGYINVYTSGASVYGTPAVGQSADVYGNGSAATYITATWVNLGGSSSSSAPTPPTSGYNMHVSGPIVAVQSSTEFQMNAGGSIGYINVYTSGASVYGTPAVGQNADVYGNGSAATYITATWVNLGGSSSSSAPTPPTSGYTMHVSGPIVAVQSSTEFQMNAGGSIGYINVYTSGASLYGTPTVGQTADVYGNGSAATYITAIWVNVGGSSSSSAPTPPSSGYTMHVSGPIVAVQSSTEFQMNAGGSIGYINVYTSSASVYGSPSVGQNVDVYGNGSAATYITAIWVNVGGSSSGSSAPPANVPNHVLTTGIIYGYGGTPSSVPVSSMAPYISWAQTDTADAAALRGAGIKVDIYMNFWRNYSTDNPIVGYNDLKPGGAHAAAEVKDCSGNVAYDSSYGGGYEANAMSSDAAGHAAVLANFIENQYGGNYDALFSDDTGALWGLPTPCGYTDSTYKTYTNDVTASLGKPTFVNTLSAGTSVVSQVGYAGASNVIGAMCESCYSYWDNPNGYTQDFAQSGSQWVDTENGEALLVSQQKIFWDYARAVGDASSSTGLRMYTYASFLLTYDPNYAMLQEVFKTPSGFEVFPETGLVPTQPLTTSTNVSSYQRSGGAYMREFGACYYRGTNEGKCAVIVNPSSSSSASLPTSSYGHAMTLSGYGVLDGGSVGFSGSVPSSLGATSAAILFP